MRELRAQLTTGRPVRKAVTPVIAHGVSSLDSTECPVSGTASTRAPGYCAAVRRASSSGVRRSSRPASTSTGTAGPADRTFSVPGVDGHAVHTLATLSDSTDAGENGPHEAFGRDATSAASALARP